MVADADPLPQPTPLETVAANRDASTVAITLVSVTLPGKMQRVNITIDEGLLDEIDAIAETARASWPMRPGPSSRADAWAVPAEAPAGRHSPQSEGSGDRSDGDREL